uniref:Uncharacterized protein n=1 Tax=Aliivibrio fischeri TaxID=668 RepID=H2ES90_ALIFS|nr:hypothetical protein [Aliivibrio fischeri]
MSSTVNYLSAMFIRNSIDRWGDKYDYSQVVYKGSLTPVVLICKKHEISFLQTPKAHFVVSRHCCPICYKEALKGKK